MLQKHKISFDNITVVPSIHQRIYFADLVRSTMLNDKYDCICVELPDYARNKVLEAVNELPDIHTVAIEDMDNPGVSFIPIELTDSIIMAVKTSQELELPLYFIDQNVSFFQSNSPKINCDDHPVLELGLKKFYNAINRDLQKLPENPWDAAREKYIARRLLALKDKFRSILLVCGMSHWHRIRYYLKNPRRIGRPPLPYVPKSIDIFKVAKHSLKYVLHEIPYILSWYIHMQGTAGFRFDRLKALAALVEDAVSRYKGSISPLIIRKMLEYTVRLSGSENYFTPDLLDLVAAAKQTVDEDFGRIIYRIGSDYKYYTRSSRYFLIDFKASFREYGFEGLLPHKDFPLQRKWKRKMTPGLISTDNYLILENRQNYERNIRRPLPLFKRLKALETFLALRRKPGRLKGQLRRRRQSFKVRTDGNLVVIFERGQAYNFHRHLNGFNKNDCLIFAAETPLLNMAFVERSGSFFGSFARLKNTSLEQDPFSRDDYPGFVQSAADKIIFLALVYSEKGATVPVLGAEPPSSEFYQAANHTGRRIEFVPLSSLSPDLVHQMRMMEALGKGRLKQLISSIS